MTAHGESQTLLRAMLSRLLGTAPRRPTHRLKRAFAVLWPLLMPLLLVAGAPVSSPVKVEIVSIAGRKVREVVEVGALEELAGTLAAISSGLPESTWVLQIARRELGQQDWHILSPLAKLGVAQRKIQWRLTGVDFGSDLAFGGCGRGFEVMAIVATHPLPLSAFDETALSAVAALSAPVKVRRQACHIPPLPPPQPNIRIAEIGSRTVDPDGRYEVRMQETLHGEVIKPAGSAVRLVVQPLNGTQRWVMEMDPQISGPRWTGRAQFGRQGLDEWVDFLVYAVVTDPRLPTGRGIKPDEWQRLQRQFFLATSPAILVRRVELPAGEQGTVEILAIEGKSVVEPGLYLVDRLSGIVGILQGHSRSRNEDVWVLAMERHGDDLWRVLGKASIREHRFWQLPPTTLGEPGALIDLVAVLSPQPIVTLGSDELSHEISISQRVQVVLDDRSPVELLWTCVGGQQAAELEILTVPPFGDLAGLVGGRPLAPAEQVAIFKRRLDKGPWQLLRHASFGSEQRSHWSVLPVEFGRPGESLLLLAAITRGEVRDPESADPGAIVRLSHLLEIKIRQSSGAYGRCR